MKFRGTKTTAAAIILSCIELQNNARVVGGFTAQSPRFAKCAFSTADRPPPSHVNPFRNERLETTTSLRVGTIEKPASEADDALANGESKPTIDMDPAEIVKNLKNKKGIYQLTEKVEYDAFLAANPNVIVVLKFYAPWCRACKGLAPKFMAVANDKRYEKLPMIFAELSVEHNRDFVKQLGILALPSVHLYAGSDGLVENFPCGPSKVPILKRKIADLVNERVNEVTYELQLVGAGDGKEEDDSPCAERVISTTEGDVVVTEEQIAFLRTDIPYFDDLPDAEFDKLLAKARLQSFEPGSVIIRQGQPSKTFYVIESGEVEICVKTGFQDPLTDSSNYLGAALNTLSSNNYFGERAMITGENLAASIRAVKKVRCFAFNKEDIPITSVLSGQKSPTSDRLAKINDKYGVDLETLYDTKGEVAGAGMANQQRGSVNSPAPIPGVDTEESTKETTSTKEPVKQESEREGMILTLLYRFKQIRQAAKCFEYIMKTQPRWGDTGEMNRRLLLVSKLTASQRQEFKEVFQIIDKSSDHRISLDEMKNFMNSIDSERTDTELQEMLNKSNPLVEGSASISFDEFMGVMAEAEFYYLFLDTFNALDKMGSGFVRAGDLDRVLCGMRDLISDDRKSIIDVEEQDLLIDYEHFSKMLLGAAL